MLPPLQIDFLVTVCLALFWLAASSAWAHGLSGLKHSCDPDNWLFTSEKEYAALCYKTTSQTFKFPSVTCEATQRGSFGGANASVLLGFLNWFLWSANLWFLYKETRWFKGSQANGQTLQEPDV